MPGPGIGGRKKANVSPGIPDTGSPGGSFRGGDPAASSPDLLELGRGGIPEVVEGEVAATDDPVLVDPVQGPSPRRRRLGTPKRIKAAVSWRLLRMGMKTMPVFCEGNRRAPFPPPGAVMGDVCHHPSKNRPRPWRRFFVAGVEEKGW
jgi:hypothetical protein